jgi:UDP-glucose 4-epimerase
MNREKKIAVVTGGAGFIGAHLVKELLANGYEVRVVDNLVAGKRERLPAEVAFHQVDVQDTEALTSIFTGAHYVFHLAALPRVQFTLDHPQLAHDTNVNGTLSVLCAARAAKVGRVIFSSTSAVYGERKDSPLHEELDTRPQSPYALHKLIGELYGRLFSSVYDLSTVWLRYFNVYGPGDDPNGPYALVITKLMDKRRRGEALTITGDGTQTRDFVHVRDVVRANLLAAESPNVGKSEVINIGSGQSASVNRIAELVGGPVVYIEARLEPHDTLADSTRAKELLGWEPSVSLAEGIAELKKELGL